LLLTRKCSTESMLRDHWSDSLTATKTKNPFFYERAAAEIKADEIAVTDETSMHPEANKPTSLAPQT